MTTRTLRVATVTALLVGVLAGCGDDDTDPPAGQQPAPDLSVTTEPSPEPTAGSVTAVDGDIHHWPNGVTVTLTRVESVDPSLGVDVPDGVAVVRVTILVGNTSDTAAVFAGEGYSWMDLHYGANAYLADPEAGYDSDDPAELLQNDDPAQVPPGGQAEVFESFRVPADELEVLAVTVHIPTGDGGQDRYPEWTFTDAHELLEQ